METVDEVRKDFEAAVSQIDFGRYAPSSTEFQQALDLGLMWLVLTTMAGIVKPSEVKAVAVDEIGEEILLAKRMLQKAIDTDDSSYRELAVQELETAETLVKKSLARLPSGEERAKLKTYENSINEIRRQI